MWYRKKSELEQLKCHPGIAKDFLHNVDARLYQTSLGNIEKIDQLTLEQDAHTSEDGFQGYLLTARRAGDSVSRLPMPVFVMKVMEELLSGFTVVTDVREEPIPRRVVEELANYRIAPHMFSVSYTRFHNSHPTDKEKVFFNGMNAMVTVTDGMNRALLETLYMTPGYDNTLSALQCGVEAPVSFDGTQSYDHVKCFAAENSHIWMNYCWTRLLISIQWSEEAEKNLVDKLRRICQEHEIPLEIGWPCDE